jgi:hypothetical protein
VPDELPAAEVNELIEYLSKLPVGHRVIPYYFWIPEYRHVYDEQVDSDQRKNLDAAF